MTLVEKIQEEIELADFYAGRSGAVNILRIFQRWAQNNLIDSGELVELLNKEWREAHETRI